MSWREYLSLTQAERHAIWTQFQELQRESGVGSFSGQSRLDRKFGLK